MGETIELFPSQVEHAQRLKRILQAHPLALDLSMLGAGKTYTASHIAKDPTFGFRHVVVIAPVSVQPKWDDMRRRFDVPISNNISFSQVRSLKCKQPKHGLLMRRDYTAALHLNGLPVLVDKVEFTVTSKFRGHVDAGVLLIVDEIQSIKNVSSQFLACRTLIREIVTSGGTSRVLLLSGSPLDRREQVVVLFRTMHVMKGDELASYNIGQRVLEWRGMQEIETHCAELDSEGVARVRARHSRAGHIAQGRLERYCYDLFQIVFKQVRASAMPVQSVGCTVTKLNAFFEVEDNRERAALSFGVNALSHACSYNSATLQVDYQRNGTALESLRMITKSLVQIETGKIDVLIRAATKILESDEQSKVVICINYSATLRDLMNGLRRFDPLTLDGMTTVQRRMQVLKSFQAPTSAHRLLIGNVSVMSTGIDLDDKDGSFPRTALVNPSYSTIALYQLGHRFLRADTGSNSKVLFVFGKHATELHLLEALARKSCVMKQTTREQSVAGVVFPGDYTRVDGDELLELHEKRMLVRVIEPVPDNKEATAELAMETDETCIADLDERDPSMAEDDAVQTIGAPEQETLEFASRRDVHVEHVGQMLTSEPALVDSEHPSSPVGFGDLTHEESNPEIRERMIIAGGIFEHRSP